eukprot:29130-Pelagococcus_subviridis.AAC.7
MFVDLSVRVDPSNPHALREHLATALVLGASRRRPSRRVLAGADRRSRRASTVVESAASESASASDDALRPSSVPSIASLSSQGTPRSRRTRASPAATGRFTETSRAA